MPLSRKNHERIAVIINNGTCVQIFTDIHKPSDFLDKTFIINRLCEYLKEDNPKFDEKIFREWTK